MGRTSVTAFAPSTVANVAVGFDILGFPVDAVGDKVTLTKISEPIVRIESIEGAKLSLEAAKNCATVGLLQLVEDLNLKFGFAAKIEKGIPLGSGMGGSAASSVAAVVAANALLDKPLSTAELLPYALMGETLASDAAHPDNVAPCLWGGLTLVQSTNPVTIVRIPVPENIFCVLVHPHFKLETRRSRAALSDRVALKDHVRQSANLAGFIAGAFKNDLALIRASLKDVLIEPQRSGLIPGFTKAKEAALKSGALGFSISGSGPSVFAFCEGFDSGVKITEAIVAAFKAEKIDSDSWISPISEHGARILE